MSWEKIWKKYEVEVIGGVIVLGFGWIIDNYTTINIVWPIFKFLAFQIHLPVWSLLLSILTIVVGIIIFKEFKKVADDEVVIRNDKDRFKFLLSGIDTSEIGYLRHNNFAMKNDSRIYNIILSFYDNRNSKGYAFKDVELEELRSNLIKSIGDFLDSYQHFSALDIEFSISRYGKVIDDTKYRQAGIDLNAAAKVIAAGFEALYEKCKEKLKIKL